MSLKIKTFGEILSDMVTWVSTSGKKLSNFYVGSVIRTLLESVAVEIESLYFQMFKGFKYAIENSIFYSFDFPRMPATYSSGTLAIKFKFPIPNTFVIEAGTKVCTLPVNGEVVYFVSLQDLECEKGVDYVELTVQCTVAGTIGNVPQYAIKQAVTPITFVEEIYNPEPFINGKEKESKADQKKRFITYIQTLARGTASAIQYACLKVEGVSGAYVDESIGLIIVYAHNSEGNLPDELKQALLLSIQDYRSAGIPVEILAVTKKIINLTITVYLQPDFDIPTYQSLVHDSVVSFLDYYTVSKSLVKAELLKYIMGIDESAISNVEIDMDSTIPVNKYELIRAGEVTINIIQ